MEITAFKHSTWYIGIMCTNDITSLTTKRAINPEHMRKTS